MIEVQLSKVYINHQAINDLNHNFHYLPVSWKRVQQTALSCSTRPHYYGQLTCVENTGNPFEKLTSCFSSIAWER